MQQKKTPCTIRHNVNYFVEVDVVLAHFRIRKLYIVKKLRKNCSSGSVMESFYFNGCESQREEFAQFYYFWFKTQRKSQQDGQGCVSTDQVENIDRAACYFPCSFTLSWIKFDGLSFPINSLSFSFCLLLNLLLQGDDGDKMGNVTYFPANATFNHMYFPYYGKKAQVRTRNCTNNIRLLLVTYMKCFLRLSMI